MEFDPQDQDVIGQLKKLKQADREYPPELLAARRQRFLRQMGEVGLGVGAGASLQQAGKGAKALPTSPIASKLLETVLVVAIIAEAGAVTYFYRDKLTDILRDFVASGEVQEIISPPGVNTPLISTIETLPSAATFTPIPQLLIVSEAPIVVAITPTQTPAPGLLNATNAVNATVVQVNSTPDLIENTDLNGNNGNHYGQTPKPERTKENNGNNDKPPKEDPPKENPPKQDPPKEDEQPPKNDPPPKEPKPTKSK